MSLGIAIQDVQNFFDSLRTNGVRNVLSLEMVLPIETVFIPSNSFWYLIVLVNRFKSVLLLTELFEERVFSTQVTRLLGRCVMGTKLQCFHGQKERL